MADEYLIQPGIRHRIPPYNRAAKIFSLFYWHFSRVSCTFLLSKPAGPLPQGMLSHGGSLFSGEFAV